MFFFKNQNYRKCVSPFTKLETASNFQTNQNIFIVNEIMKIPKQSKAEINRIFRFDIFLTLLLKFNFLPFKYLYNVSVTRNCEMKFDETFCGKFILLLVVDKKCQISMTNFVTSVILLS